MKRVVGQSREMSKLGKAFRSYGMAIFASLACFMSVAETASAAPPHWKTGQQFERALETRVRDVVWSAGTPLRQAVTTLARTQGVAIMLDRRVDPESAIELSVHDVTIREVIEQLAAQCGAASCYLEGVVYLGPRAELVDLSTVAQARRAEAQHLPRPQAQRCVAARVWGWEALAEPRALMETLAHEANVTVDGLAELPHDLWPAMELPALAWTDRVTLVLAGFGKTFEFIDGGQRIRLVPIPAPSMTVKSYLANVPPARLEVIRNLFPQAEIDTESQQITLRGTPELHERLRQVLKKPSRDRTTPRPAGKTVLTLKVNNQPVDAILRTLERQLDLSFEFEDGLADRLGTRVTFDLREATLQELLQAALTPAKLAFREQKEVIVITAGPSPQTNDAP
ncbi:MAG: hypothetical protein ACYC0X_04195 [Pirellulaceae bacterium]